MRIDSAKDLAVYQKAYELAMRIFEFSKHFPLEERLALTGQIRRSPRSVCLNLREAWAKRRKPELSSLRLEVGKMLGSMIKNPDSFLL